MNRGLGFTVVHGRRQERGKRTRKKSSDEAQISKQEVVCTPGFLMPRVRYGCVVGGLKQMPIPRAMLCVCCLVHMLLAAVLLLSAAVMRQKHERHPLTTLCFYFDHRKTKRAFCNYTRLKISQDYVQECYTPAAPATTPSDRLSLSPCTKVQYRVL